MERTPDTEADPAAAVVAGCVGAPDRPICGLPRRERLTHTLRRQGYRLVDDPARADLVVPDCHVRIGDEQLHLCTDGVRAAERRLLRALRKDIDGVISRTLNRPVSLAFTRLLMNTRVEPNHVTTLIMLIGISSGFVVALGGYWAGVAGALLLNTQSVLDGTDGELARLRFQGSRFGQWYDTVSDDLSNLSFFAGAAVAATHAPILYIGLVGAGVFVVTQAILYYILATVYGSGNLQHFEWEAEKRGGMLARLDFVLKRDFFCFAFFILALFGRTGLDVAVVASAAGAVITFGALLRQLARHGTTPPSRAAKSATAVPDVEEVGTVATSRRARPPL